MGSALTCTIEKGSFSKTAPGAVAPDHTWKVKLGGGTMPPIPAGTGYKITAKLVALGGSDDVSDIEIVQNLIIVIEEINCIDRDTYQDLSISGKVAGDTPIDALLIEVHAFGKAKRSKVVSCGWIKVPPAGGKWKIKLPAPKAGQFVVHVYGVDTKGENGGVVVANVCAAVE